MKEYFPALFTILSVTPRPLGDAELIEVNNGLGLLGEQEGPPIGETDLAEQGFKLTS